MAYRIEKNSNSGRPEIVIDGFENGIADSPYTGIANMRNMNTSYYEKVAYVNYIRQASALTGGNMKRPQFYCTSPAGLNYVIDSSGQVWKQNGINASGFTLLTGNPSGGAGGQGIAFWQGYLFVFRQNAIDICGNGFGDGGVTSSNWNNNAQVPNAFWPIAAPSNVTLTGSLSVGDTSATLSSYNDPGGGAQTQWLLPTGIYPLVTSHGELVSALFTFGSTAISFSLPLIDSGSSSVNINPIISSTATLDNSTVQHMSIVSGNNGNLFFCNGSFIGSLSVPSGYVFNLSNPASYRFNYSALPLSQYESAIWLCELYTDMVIAGINKIYKWNYSTAIVNGFAPIPESVNKIINILNKVYVFAGQKGNIYWLNGYSASPLKKIPDSITSQGGPTNDSVPAIDPIWSWGGIMSHRRKLFFQAQSTSADATTNFVSGIFSLDLDTNAINFENQNSFGLTSASTSPNGILIDGNQLSATPTTGIGYNSYYSGWSNGFGSVLGGIDFNNTTLYNTFDPIIETDLVPTGTFAEKKTIQNVEFKLDQPLKSGDSIRVSARQSLSESYILLGTTTSTVLSDFYTPIPIQDGQWVQLKIEISCNTITTSSFVRLREIRIRM